MRRQTNVIHYGIPSFRRVRQCRELTAQLLLDYGVRPSRITVFVSDRGELADYVDAFSDTKISVVPGKLGLGHQRKYMQTYYPKGTKLVQVDDDVSEFLTKRDDKVLAPLEGGIDRVAKHAFRASKRCGAALWGINGCANAMFMKNTDTAGLRYCVGAMFGTVTPDPDIARNVDLDSSGEDFVNTIRSFLRHGCVYRLDWFTIKTKYFAPGGIDQLIQEQGGASKRRQRETRQRVHERALRRIAKQYPDVARVVEKKKGVNLRLKVITLEKFDRPTDL